MSEMYKGKIIRKKIQGYPGNDYAIYIMRTEKRDYRISLMRTEYEIGDTLRFWHDGNGDHAELIKACTEVLNA